MRLFFTHKRNLTEHRIDLSLNANRDGIKYTINYHDDSAVSLSVSWHNPEYANFYRQLCNPTRNDIKSEFAKLIRHAKAYMEVEND